MWIAVGGLTFLASFCYFLYQRRYAAWASGKGEMPVSLPDGFYWQLTTGKKGGSYRLGLDCPAHFDFLIGKERAIDRMFKAIGLSQELQVNDPGFDDAIYVGCDDLYFQRLLKRSAPARAAIAELKLRHRELLTGKIRLQCRDGRLWLEARVKPGFTAGQCVDSLRADSESLLSLQQALQSLPTMLLEPVARRMRWHAAVLSSLSAVLATCAALGWFVFMWDGNHQLFLPELLFRSLLPAVLLWCGLLVATLILLVRTSRFHLVLIELLLLGSWGAFGTVSNAYMHVNIDHDDKAPELRCVEVTDRYTRRSRRRASYYVVLSGWQLADGRYMSKLKLSVSSSVYYTLRQGRPAHFLEHEGRLGYPWLSDLAFGCPGSSDKEKD